MSVNQRGWKASTHRVRRVDAANHGQEIGDSFQKISRLFLLDEARVLVLVRLEGLQIPRRFFFAPRQDQGKIAAYRQLGEKEQVTLIVVRVDQAENNLEPKLAPELPRPVLDVRRFSLVKLEGEEERASFFSNDVIGNHLDVSKGNVAHQFENGVPALSRRN